VTEPRTAPGEDGPRTGPVIALEGYLAFDQAAPLWADLRARLGLDGPSPAPHATVDLSKVAGADGGVLALLIQLRTAAEKRGARLELVGANEGVSALLDLYAARMARPALHPPPARQGMLEQIGATGLRVHDEFVGVLTFLGKVVYALGDAVRRPASVPWADVARTLEKVGADGLPIVLLISFLIGLIVAFQSAVQLKQFGAEHLVADAVALSITRALGPLFTAMIIAGRSGASYAAELGTMRVSEEVDALRTLGLDPFRYLVLPRVLALVIALPLLTIIADVLGLVGGFVVGVVDLDLPPVAYLSRTQRALDLWDVGSGLIKSVAFGLSIALIACERGLSTSGGAEGVGRSTTASVVTALFSLVVLDTLLTIVFMVYDVF
jgi:phospholipid/cholesterol/gamma-HCH transport system permease protein